jgi:hypothetical protein
MVEFVVAMGLFVIIGTAGLMLFTSGSAMWSVTGAQIELQQNARQGINRLFLELQESGRNSADIHQVTILDNQGVNATDIIRFKVPLCVCGQGVIDEDGEVRSWGAPMTWGDSNCNEPLIVDNNGKVTICHLPLGNPENTQTLNVAQSAVKAHLAHDDYIGDCDDCDPPNYTNQQIEYRIDANGQLLRRVLNSASAVVDSEVMAANFNGFQAVLSAAQDSVTVTMNLTEQASQGRDINMSRTMEVILRNF